MVLKYIIIIKIIIITISFYFRYQEIHNSISKMLILILNLVIRVMSLEVLTSLYSIQKSQIDGRPRWKS